MRLKLCHPFQEHPGDMSAIRLHLQAHKFNWIQNKLAEIFSKIALFSVILYSTRCSNPYRENTGILLLSFQYTTKQFHENQLLAGLQFISLLVNNLSFLSLHVWMDMAYGFLWAHSSLPKNYFGGKNVLALLWNLVEAYEMLNENIKSDIWGSWLCCAEEIIQNVLHFLALGTYKDENPPNLPSP